MLGLVAAALIAMQAYMKRGVQGRLRDLANQISPKQFEPIDTNSITGITRTVTSTEREHSGNYTVEGSETGTTNYSSTTVEQ